MRSQSAGNRTAGRTPVAGRTAEPSEARVAARLGLTASESRLAALLAEGLQV